MSDISLPENELSLSAKLEALLFVAPGTLTAAQLAAALDVPSAQVERELEVLTQAYEAEGPSAGLQSRL
jgi:chromosome segregation and condensation protein ScpB